MDLLKDIVANVKKQEVSKKRKLLSSADTNNDPSKGADVTKRPRTSKYLSRGELERLAALEREQEMHARTPSPANAPLASSSSASPNRSSSTSPRNANSRPSSRLAHHGRSGNRDDGEDDDDEPQLDIPSEEVIRRLRARGQPIRLFGESDTERIVRMRNIEADADDSDKGQRNEYARQLARTEVGLELEMLQKAQAKAAKERKGSSAPGGGDRSADPAFDASGAPAGNRSTNDTTLAAATNASASSRGDTGGGVYKPEYDVSELSSKLLATNPDKCFILVYVYLKRMLEDWEHELAARPDHVRRSVQGKHEATKFVQTKDNLKPFFKLLKRKAVENDVMEKIADILRNVQLREYVRANDHYLQLSIGNAPWPIGVTMVGIHERSAREKISSHQVAHALNDETQRKWIQSVKRIMTFAQNKYPPDDPAKMVG